MHFPGFCVFVALSTAVLAQVNISAYVAELPLCTLQCAGQTLPSAGCNSTNMQQCLCTNDTLQNELFVCIEASCNGTDAMFSATVSQDYICKGVPQQSRSGNIMRVSIIISGITFGAIFLRIISRHLTSHIWWDDWVIVITGFFMIPMSVIPIYNATKGFGQHSWNVPVQNLTILRQLYYVSQILYVITQNLTKISILFLYLRIFLSPRFRLCTKILMAWITCRATAFLVAVILQCIPISSIWDLSSGAKCVNSPGIVFSGAAFSIAEDLVTILLPIPELKSLNLSWKRKTALIFMFALGSFACITSMIRLKHMIYYNLNALDGTWTSVDVVIWSIIEVYSAMVCACLVAIRPLLVRCIPSVFNTVISEDSIETSTWRQRVDSRTISAGDASKYWRQGHGMELRSTWNENMGPNGVVGLDVERDSADSSRNEADSPVSGDDGKMGIWVTKSVHLEENKPRISRGSRGPTDG